MRLGVHPAQFRYLDDFRQFGVGYHYSMRTLDFATVTDKEVWNGKFVVIWSPCGLIQLLREFYGEKIVGIRFETVFDILKVVHKSPAELADGHDYFSCVKSFYEMRKHRLEVTAQRNAEKIYTRAESALTSGEKLQIPESVSELIQHHWLNEVN